MWPVTLWPIQVSVKGFNVYHLRRRMIQQNAGNRGEESWKPDLRYKTWKNVFTVAHPSLLSRWIHFELGERRIREEVKSTWITMDTWQGAFAFAQPPNEPGVWWVQKSVPDRLKNLRIKETRVPSIQAQSSSVPIPWACGRGTPAGFIWQIGLRWPLKFSHSPLRGRTSRIWSGGISPEGERMQ